MIALIFIIIVLLSLYNAFVVLHITAYSVDDQKRYSKIWHFYSGLVRFSIIIIIATYNFTEFTEKTIYIITGLTLLNWIIYDLILNILRGKAIFYRGTMKSGTGSVIDKFFKNDGLYILCKIIALVSGIILLIL